MLFEGKIRSPRGPRSLILPAAAIALGTALQESATAGTAELADGTKPFAGFSQRASKVGGPTLEDHYWPGRLELPYTAGQEGSTDFWDEVEAEGSGYLSTDETVGITGATPRKTLCSFVGGKFAVAAAGQWAEYLVEAILTPEVEGNVRVRFTKVAGVQIPAEG